MGDSLNYLPKKMDAFFKHPYNFIKKMKRDLLFW